MSGPQSFNIMELPRGSAQDELTRAFLEGVRRAPECMTVATSYMGFAATRAMMEDRLTVSELACTTLAGPYLDHAVEVTTAAHENEQRKGLADPPINNDGLTAVLPVLFEFGTQGIIRTAASFADRDMGATHTKLGSATPQEIGTTESFLSYESNLSDFQALVIATAQALESGDPAGYCNAYKEALLGNASSSFPQPLTAWHREDRKGRSLPKTEELKRELVKHVGPLVRAIVRPSIAPRGWSADTVNSAVNHLLLP